MNPVTRAVDRPVCRRLVLPLDEALDGRRVGGKAHNLARLRAALQPVPNGFVIATDALEEFLTGADLRPLIAGLCARLDARSPTGIQCAAETIAALVRQAPLPAGIGDLLDAAIADLGSPLTIVRSSAVGEDSKDASFAGQLDSIANVSSPAALRRAVVGVWASQWSARSLSYQLSRRVSLAGMGVVVQTQVAATVSGVLFTRIPGRDTGMLAEYCAGPGEALVSGRTTPGRLVITRSPFRWRRESTLEEGEEAERILLNGERIAALARAGVEIERELGCPQDIEWTIDGAGRLWILQARPITTSTPIRIRGDRPLVHWSNANVSENFPYPISPLLYSVARQGYYHYFRNLGRAFGISRKRLRAMERPLREIIGVHHARMYYNLTSIHGVLRSAPFGDLLASSFNVFTGATETGSEAAAAHAGRLRALEQAAESCVIAVRTAWQYLFLTTRVERFEKTVARFADATQPDRLESRTCEQLLDDLQGLLDIRFHKWTGAALADAAAMVSYALLEALLSRADLGRHAGAAHNNLLKGIHGVVSGIPAQELWDLAELVRNDDALSRCFASGSSSEVLAAVRRNETFREFRDRVERYLDEWGFRCSGELMLTVPSFQEEPERVVQLIQAYVTSGGESPRTILERQARERLDETRRAIRALQGVRVSRWLPFLDASACLRILLAWTRKSIRLRERARMKQALLYSRLRRIALAIGARLAEREQLAAPEDIFFLTAEEIEAVLSGTAMFPDMRSVVAARRAAYAELTSVTPPDTFALEAGEYLPAAGDRAADGGDRTARELRGIAACGGVRTARAAVLEAVSEAGRLRPGDILVTRQTDPGWGPVFPLISGLVVERGGMLSHGAIIAREFGIPSVVGVRGATDAIRHGARLHVDGDRGVVRILPETL